MKTLIPPTAARQHIDAHLPTIATISCPLDKCAGRILRQAVTADRPLPPFDRSMMDGYAIRATDLAQSDTFTIVAQAPAGAPAVELGSAQNACAEIMTGAVVPADADCVVPYEVTERIDEQTIRLLNPSDHVSGNCIHPLGSDHPAGQVLLAPNTVIGSREIAIAATCGSAQLQVTKMPTIAIVSTGDELVDVAATPAAHQIRRSNDLSIETALTNAQLSAQHRTHLPDDAAISKTKLAELIEQNTFLIISGGISMGKKDYIPATLDELGLENHFHGVLQKPGKPFGYWSNANCAVFTLPGNPLSTLVALHHYVIPAIKHAMGAPTKPAPRTVQLAALVKARDDITIFLPIKLGANNTAHSTPAQNSGDLVRILQSDGYIELPPSATKTYPAGRTFEFHPWL
ncbi:MAG: molybdopterin molybdotransferase [Lentimonas sp.]|jgi:molybdopterin molybdotransferase